MNRRNFIKGFLVTTAVVALAPLAPIVELPVEKATFESIAALTLKQYRKQLADSIFNHPKIKWETLYAAHCVKLKPESKDIIEPILYV